MSGEHQFPNGQKLSYSKKRDNFIFCNKISFNSNDTESLVKEAVKKTNITEAEAKTLTDDELINDLGYVTCIFKRDVLFSIVILNDEDEATVLKQRNKEKNLTATELTGKYADSVDTWYYYSNLFAIKQMANNEWRDSHKIDE